MIEQQQRGEMWVEPAGRVVEQIPRRRRRGLGAFLIVAGLVLLALVTLGGRAMPWNTGFIQGTIASTERFDARNLVLELGSGDVTLQPGSGSEVVVEMTRHGFGWSEAAGRRAAERLPLPSLQ